MLQPSLGVSSLDLGRPPGRPLFVCVVGRRRISPEFVEEVAEWLPGAGVTLFFAGTTYAVVKTSVVESWPRVTSKRITADLRGADLSYANLAGADLYRATLSEANLTQTNLSYANLRGTGLSEADLTGSVGWFAGMNQPKSIESQRTSVSRGCGSAVYRGSATKRGSVVGPAE